MDAHQCIGGLALVLMGTQLARDIAWLWERRIRILAFLRDWFTA